MNTNDQQNFLFYTNSEGSPAIQVFVDSNGQTVWMTQKSMAEVFGCSSDNISLHLKNIFSEGELHQDSVTEDSSVTATDGKRYKVKLYNLDAIISVGYRVNSQNATRFRIWATGVLKSYLIKGFAMDDDRLKQGKNLFGKDYFEELLARIREIRASERRFYQKITDIYAQCSIDYDPGSVVTQKFYAKVQNKLEFAITKKTAAEIIHSRADSTQRNMGLTSWKAQKTNGKITKTDVVIAKNYLNESELSELNSIVTMYLDYAELQAKRNKAMTMNDWADRLNAFLQFNEYDILQNSGSVSAAVAKKFAEEQFDKFRVIQDAEFVSDFDRVVNEIKTTNTLPKEELQGPFTGSIKEKKDPKR